MLNIYLTNLGKYNEGELVGEWVELPITEEELDAVKERIGINERYEEMFITDYETDVDGLTVGEYDSIQELNDLAEAIENADADAIAALIYEGYHTAEEITNKLDDVYYIGTRDRYGNMNLDEFIGYYLIEDVGVLNIPEELQPYFNYEAYGRDARLNGHFYETSNGKIYEIIK